MSFKVGKHQGIALSLEPTDLKQCVSEAGEKSDAIDSVFCNARSVTICVTVYRLLVSPRPQADQFS